VRKRITQEIFKMSNTGHKNILTHGFYVNVEIKNRKLTIGVNNCMPTLHMTRVSNTLSLHSQVN
jgi:hypothetical protein